MTVPSMVVSEMVNQMKWYNAPAAMTPSRDSLPSSKSAAVRTGSGRYAGADDADGYVVW